MNKPKTRPRPALPEHPKLVKVVWRDHWADGGEAKPPWSDDCTWTSVGWVIRETEELLSITPHLVDATGDCPYADVSHIWKVMILSRKTLRA